MPLVAKKAHVASQPCQVQHDVHCDIKHSLMSRLAGILGLSKLHITTDETKCIKHIKHI